MWKLQVLLYSFLIPKEFSLHLGELNLSPYRIILILLAPWVIKSLLVRRKFQWQHFDTLAVLVSVWPFVALAFNTDLFKAIESGGVLFLQTFVSFFTVRLLVYRYSQLKQLSVTILTVATIMALMALPEAVTGKLFIHEIASKLTNSTFDYAPENRFRVWRSYGPTDHPIILGTICAISLPLGLALWRRKKIRLGMTGISFLGVISSASSGPLLSVIAQISLYLWAKITQGNRYKWWLLISLMVFVYIVIDVLSNRDPLRVMFTYLLFNEHNGYVRFNMWKNSFFLATQSLESLAVGYGFSIEMMSLLENAFWTRLMSASVDSYWMLIMLRYGMPMLLLSIAMTIMVLRSNVRNYRFIKDQKRKNLVQAWMIVTVSFGLVACTVHFWGFMSSLFFIVLAAGGANIRAPKEQPKTQKAKASASHHHVRKAV